MRITKHAQSCFEINLNDENILIDPGSYVFGAEKKTPEDFKDTAFLIITHEHSDHFDLANIEKIIDLVNPEIFSTQQVVDQILNLKPDAKCSILKEELIHIKDDIAIRGIRSQHGPIPTGVSAPDVVGVIIRDGKSYVSFYHPGDTIQLKIKAEVIATPICGQVVLDINEAKDQLLNLRPKLVIPMHYDNNSYPVNVNDFDQTMESTGIRTEVLEWGQSIDF